MVAKQPSESYDSHVKEDDVYVPPKIIAYAEADIIDNTALLACSPGKADKAGGPPSCYPCGSPSLIGASSQDPVQW